MFDELRASLYDLFGYLIPGTFLLISLSLVLGLLAPMNPVYALDALSKTPIAIGFLGVGYVLGHFGQAVGNALPGLKVRPEDLPLANLQISAELMSLALSRVGQISVDAAKLPQSEILRLLDQRQISGSDRTEREMFVYREGFYRGMTFASALLGVVVVTYAVVEQPLCATGVITNVTLCATRSQVVVVGALSLLASIGFFHRMRRFGAYRIRAGVAGFVLPPPDKDDRIGV